MIQIIGWWEFVLALGVFALALGEVFGLLAARRAGLTHNVSRLVTHGLLAVLSVAYAAVAVWWSGALGGSVAGVVDTRFGIANWGLLILTGLLILALYEAASHTWAMTIGLTRSVPRLVTHVAMTTIVVLMLMMNLTTWQLYRTGILAMSDVEAGGGFLQAIGRWELVLGIGVVLLATREFVGLWAARRAGKTRNTSRLVVYGLLALLAAVYAWIEVSWARGFAGEEAISFGYGHPPIAEWGLVVVGAMLLLATYAVVVVILARHFGLTETVERLVTHLVMAALVVLIVTINLSRWQMYFDLLEKSYADSIQLPDGPR